MEGIFESALELNPNFTDEDLKKIVYDTFEQIFTYLGKAKFIRWINKEELAENMKKLVIEQFSDQEEQEHPNWNGYYTKSTNRIKLSKTGKNVNTNTHETYHFITDYRGRFNTFINEGLTEYMNVKTHNKNRFTYASNVKFVAFLHEMLGDSFIKAYFMGVDEKFEENLSTYISKDGKESLADYKKFEQTLNDLHEMLYPEKEVLNNDNQEKYNQNIIMEFKEYIKNIACNSFARKVNNLQFYKNGNLDFKEMIDEIRNTVKSAQKAVIDYQFDDIDFDNDIYKKCLEIFLEGTHILSGEEDKESKKSEIINKVFTPSEITGPNSKRPANIYFKALEDVYQNSYDSLPFKLAKIKLENNQELLKDGKFDIAKFLTQIALIKNSTNVSDLELDTIISNYLLENFSKDIDIKSVNEAIKNTLQIQISLNQMQVKSEKNTVESKFVKISDNGYIEKRDNQFWYIQIDKNSGRITESKFPNIIDCRPVGRNAFKETDLKDFDSRIIAGSIQTKTGTIQVAIDDNFENILVQSKGKVKKDCIRLENIDDLKNYIFSEELTKSLKEKIHNGEYTTILQDDENPYRIEGVFYTADIDSRSRKIDINTFIKDMEKVLKAIPNNLQSNIVNELVDELIQRNYSLDSMKYRDQIDTLKEQIKLNMVCKKTADKEKSLDNVNNILNQFNEIRKENVLENKKTALVWYATPIAKRRYEINENYKKQKAILEAKKSFIKASKKYITNRELLYGNNLFESYVTENMLGIFQTVSCPTIYSVDVDILAYIRDLRDLMQTIPEKEKIENFSEITSKSLESWFGIPARASKDNSKRVELYSQISDKLEEYVLSEKETENMDLEFFKTKFEQINAISRKEAEISRKTSLMFFEDPETSETYFSIDKIVHDPNIPDESKKIVVDTLVKTNNARIIQKRKMSDLLKNSLKNGNVATRSSVASVESIYVKAQDQEVQKS